MKFIHKERGKTYHIDIYNWNYIIEDMECLFKIGFSKTEI